MYVLGMDTPCGLLALSGFLAVGRCSAPLWDPLPGPEAFGDLPRLHGRHVCSSEVVCPEQMTFKETIKNLGKTHSLYLRSVHVSHFVFRNQQLLLQTHERMVCGLDTQVALPSAWCQPPCAETQSPQPTAQLCPRSLGVLGAGTSFLVSDSPVPDK